MGNRGNTIGRLLVCATAALFAEQAAAQHAPTFDLLPPPSLNFYGYTGLMDMPSAEMTRDGIFSVTGAFFGRQLRTTLSFQALPWLSASFRYNGIGDLNLFGFSTYWDRNFDVRFRIMKEGRYRPAVTVGLLDFAGTGLYASEYVVATKTFDTPSIGQSRGPGRLKLTAGLGWGRLGSHGSIGSPFGGKRPKFAGGTGGTVNYNQWFRGPMAPFGGIEWQANDRWGFKLEYSSDDYVTETQTSSVFKRRSSINLGMEYQATPMTRIGAYYMYGSEFGLTAQIQLNPAYPPAPMNFPAPHAITPRPSRETSPELWNTEWAASAAAPATFRDLLAPLLKEDGLVLETLAVSATSAELRFRNLRYRSVANAIGRAARAMTRALPASVETFRLIPVSDGMALSAVTVRRSDLEALEYAANAPDAIEAVLGYGDAPRLSADAVAGKDLYPGFHWALAPYFSPSYFDPDVPLRLDVGAELSATYRPAPGWSVSGTIRQRIVGNVANSRRTSNSKLPHVRTDAVLYAQYGTTLENLYAAYQWRPGHNLYARVSAGYLERMFGGVSGELLWKPVSSRLALGVEASAVRKRAFNQRLGFQNYSVITGHASAYYQFGKGFQGQVDVGRYLAGDVGATVSLDRVFNNGFSVGAFFTKTDVSAAQFGEGSFDKGIRFSIPLTWFLGKPSRQASGTTFRPVQRDGGAKLNLPGRLYPQIRDAHREALRNQRARFWD